MIELNVDEAYAFDYISILEVKKNNSQQDLVNYQLSCQKVEAQIGQTLFEKIMKSELYSELIDVNRNIYDMIDLIRQQVTVLDAKIIDDANIQRYKLKRKLQDQFFISGLTEIKTRI